MLLWGYGISSVYETVLRKTQARGYFLLLWLEDAFLGVFARVLDGELSWLQSPCL